MAILHTDDMTNTCTVTMKDGREVNLRGQGHAVNEIIALLTKHGLRWNEEVEVLDFGFYDSTPKARRREDLASRRRVTQPR
jgi:hypothetical protein